jgi:alkylation response protein AidB-like acyl-CoA dehydrogenase
MNYQPCPDDVRFILKAVLDTTPRLQALVPFTGFDDALQTQVLDEAATFIAGVIAPLQRIGDEVGCTFEAGKVTAPPGFREAYQAFYQAGWPSLEVATEDGGQGLPAILSAVVSEWLSASNQSFNMAPGLLHGAYECLKHHGSEELKKLYLPKIASGEWLATMCLTEPHAGSDLGRVRTRAVAQADGSYQVAGEKIFVSGGEQDLSDNIVHLVLCRLPDAPAGPKGLSLMLVPKSLPDGTRNTVHCDRIEHKMGLHGSPTCAMRFDEATSWLIGEVGRGLHAMFVMMNSARLHTALQGIGLLDAAWQKADAYSRERRQMRAPKAATSLASREPDAPADPIADHPAMRRILDTQRAWIDGARVLAYRTAVLLDVARHDTDAKARERAQRWCALVTPVLKAACTQQGFTGASECLQVFGGHGYVRDSGIEQIVRDARVSMIYEGTNEIQAIDLVIRKVLPDNGAAMGKVLIELRDELEASRETDADVQRRLAQLRYLTTTLAMASTADARLPFEVADDYLRVVMLTMMAWAWARIDVAIATDTRGASDARWSVPSAAFRRHILPEFDMRLGMVKRACDAALLTQNVSA